VYTLYYSPGTASMCVHLALLETKAPYERVLVDLKAGQQRELAYLKLNPSGVVPTLVIDGTPFSEAASLLMTLAVRHPEAGLAPPEASLARAAWHQWIVYLANTLQPAFRVWFYPSDVTDHATAQPLVKDAMRDTIERVWARVDSHLEARGPYLLGAQFSAADLLLIMLLRWSRNMPKPATAWPSLKEYAARLKARPSWQQLCVLEGLTEWA
jgi:glutathione S-transferase